MGLDIELSKLQRKAWDELKQALKVLEKQYDETPKFNYDNRYDVLLRTDRDWAEYQDKITKKKMDLSIRLNDFDGSDIEVIDQIHESSAHAQIRRSIISNEKIRAIKNSSKWKRLYYAVKALQDEMESFWLVTDEIKRQRSTGIRSAEVLKRTKAIVNLRNRIEVYFREGKHRDHGEALSYEYAVQEGLNNLDSARDVLKNRKYGTFRERD